MSISSSILAITDEIDGNLSIKWQNNGVFHRFWLPVVATFTDLMRIIVEIDPLFDDYLTYKDNDDEMICLGTNAEFREFIRLTAAYDLPRVVITKQKDPKKKLTLVQFKKADVTFPKILPRIAPKTHHRGVNCSSCEFPIIGMRYRCVDCNDYNLCEVCEKTGMHEEHSMLRLVTEWAFKPSYVCLNRADAYKTYEMKDCAIQTDTNSTVPFVVNADRVVLESVDGSSIQSQNKFLHAIVESTQECVKSVNQIYDNLSNMSASVVCIENRQNDLRRLGPQNTLQASNKYEKLNGDSCTLPPLSTKKMSDDFAHTLLAAGDLNSSISVFSNASSIENLSLALESSEFISANSFSSEKRASRASSVYSDFDILSISEDLY